MNTNETRQPEPPRTCADPIPDHYIVCHATHDGLQQEGPDYEAFADAEDAREKLSKELHHGAPRYYGLQVYGVFLSRLAHSHATGCDE